LTEFLPPAPLLRQLLRQLPLELLRQLLEQLRRKRGGSSGTENKRRASTSFSGLERATQTGVGVSRLIEGELAEELAEELEGELAEELAEELVEGERSSKRLSLAPALW
jgi:hypothetical protein